MCVLHLRPSTLNPVPLSPSQIIRFGPNSRPNGRPERLHYAPKPPTNVSWLSSSPLRGRAPRTISATCRRSWMRHEQEEEEEEVVDQV